MKFRTPVCLAAALVLAGSDARAQQPWSAELATRVDKVFERMDKPTSPGCALAVVREGRVVYTRGYGMANLDHDIAITPSTVFHVASVSKQFTAAAVLLLARDGKLSLDDDVRKYVPELPDFGAAITIRHLIHHTSGLRDQWELLILAGWRYSLDLITDDDVLHVMARQKDLNFRPGAEHVYCNTGYTLLATIVKQVSGQSFREFTAARMFKPLGMTRTFFRDDHAEIIKGQAYGYVPDRDTFRLSVTNFDTAGATSLHTTVEDMALWDRNFDDGRVGGQEFLAALLRKGALASGEELAYASGLTHGSYRGLPTIGHGGSDAGYRADYLRFPGQQTSFACFCNLSSANPSELTRRVADVYLADKLGPAPAAAADDRPAVSISAEELGRYEGLYWQPGTDNYRKLVAKSGTLEVVYGQTGVPLKAVGGAVFAGRAADLRVDVSATGRRLTETVRSGAVKPVTFEGVELCAPTAAQAAEYTGVYHSEEIEPAFRVEIADGKILLRRLKVAPANLEPLTRDVFRGSAGTLRFSRDAKGRVSGFTLSSGRIRGFRFTRDAVVPQARPTSGGTPRR
jgi:CubicO group peptidase (beta-lactamase class C family)